MSLLDKIIFVLDQPSLYLRKLTLPPAEKDNYEKKWAIIFPVPGFIMVLMVLFYLPPWWSYFIVIPFGIAASLVINMTSA